MRSSDNELLDARDDVDDEESEEEYGVE